jgi:hypothetical protein
MDLLVIYKYFSSKSNQFQVYMFTFEFLKRSRTHNSQCTQIEYQCFILIAIHKISHIYHLLSTCLNQDRNVSGHVFCVLGVSIFPLSRIVVLEFWNCFDSAEFCVYFIVILTFIGISYMFPSIHVKLIDYFQYQSVH